MNQRLNFLLQLYLNQISTESEETELFDLLNQDRTDDVEMMIEAFMKELEPTVDEERKSELLMKIRNDEAFHTSTPLTSTSLSIADRDSMLRLGSAQAPRGVIWRRVAAAAAILVMVSVGGYLIFKNKKNQDIAKTGPQENLLKNDVAAPTTAKATITLSDGRTVALDSVASGTLATQGNVNVVKTADGKIVYNGSSAEMAYNTLTNPRGSKVVDMTLGDGTRVWLNAGSSVTYPVAFVGSKRKVSITGEAYFEVTHNAAMPFKVNKGEMEVTDLGTQFNVKAYDDEINMKVTLLEGSVKVTNGNASGLLKPGQQAQVLNVATQKAVEVVKVVNGVDVEEVMAWKNGFFKFKEASLESVMREVTRWYDVEVKYLSKPNMQFGGKMDRNSTLMQVLKILEVSGVKFKLEGKTLTVL